MTFTFTFGTCASIVSARCFTSSMTTTMLTSCKMSIKSTSRTSAEITCGITIFLFQIIFARFSSNSQRMIARLCMWVILPCVYAYSIICQFFNDIGLNVPYNVIQFYLYNFKNNVVDSYWIGILHYLPEP